MKKIKLPNNSPYALDYFERGVFAKHDVLLKNKFDSDVTIAFFGDLHIGSSGCDWDLMVEHVKYFIRNNIYVILMGDLLETATRYSLECRFTIKY